MRSGKARVAACATATASLSECPGRTLNDTVAAGSCPAWLTVSGPAPCESLATDVSGTSAPWSERTYRLPSDAGSLDGFTNNVDSLTVSPDYAKGTLDGAKKLATQISGALLTKLAPCSSAGDRACADTFVTSLGAKQRDPRKQHCNCRIP